MKRSNSFVIDTNILISAFILPNSVSRKALDKARKKGKVMISEATAAEFTEVFIRPKFDKFLPLETRLEIIDDFISLAYVIEPNLSIVICRDPKDDKFLELAVAANVDCIVTGDMDLLVLNPFKDIPIKTAAEFLTYWE
jgi:putative PIN family toxin of toxin-antitoxin system